MAGFGSSNVNLVRLGHAVDHDPNAEKPLNFSHHVNSPEYNEYWVEGLDIFHNPQALNSFDPTMLPGAAHHWILPDGQMDSHTPEWHPLGSVTYIMVSEDPT